MLHKYFKYVASKSCLNIKVKDLVLYLSPRAKVLYLFPASLQNVQRQPTTIEEQQEENTITIELKRSGQFDKALALKSEKIVYCPIEKVGQRPNPDVTLWPLTPRLLHNATGGKLTDTFSSIRLFVAKKLET